MKLLLYTFSCSIHTYIVPTPTTPATPVPGDGKSLGDLSTVQIILLAVLLPVLLIAVLLVGLGVCILCWKRIHVSIIIIIHRLGEMFFGTDKLT